MTKDANAKDWGGLLTAGGGRLYSDPANAPGDDETPNQFTFTDQTDVAVSTVITSAAVAIAGLGTGISIVFTATGGTIDKNSDGNFQTTQTLANGDTMRARVTSSSSESTGVSCSVTGGGVTDIFTATTEGEAASWQLAAGHFYPSNMTPVITAPRPDAETAAWAVCRRWPSATAWRHPIEVQGGAWPFKYEILDDGGATGLTVTETLPSDWLTNGLQNYGVLTWASPTVGTYEITVRVTDQEATTVDRTFTLSIIDRENTTYFVWVDIAAGDNGNDGSFTSPKADHAGWYGPNLADASNTGKQVHFMAGTYPISTGTLTGSTVARLLRLDDYKPQVFNAAEAGVILDGENEGYFVYFDATGDAAMLGFEFRNPNVIDGTLPRSQFIRFLAGAATRSLVNFNKFDGTVGTGGSNSACIGYENGTHTYASASHNEFYNVKNMDHVLLYTTNYMVAQGNVSTGLCEGGQGFFIKGEAMNLHSYRANRHLAQGCPLLFLSSFTGTLKQNIEVCWNNIQSTDPDYHCIGFGQGGGGAYGAVWLVRNNMTHDYLWMFGVEDGPWVIEENVSQCDTAYVATEGINVEDSATATITIQNNVAGDSGVLDGTTNLLVGASRTSYLGLRGCEVA